MKVKIKKLAESVNIPEYKTEGSSGFDLEANFSLSVSKEPILIKGGAVALIPTCLAFEIPRGFEIQVRSRSGLALKNSVFVLNSPGTIDSDFRGEVKVILFNASKEDFRVENNMRVAQAVLTKVEKAEFEMAENLEETKRGEKGFGSTKL